MDKIGLPYLLSIRDMVIPITGPVIYAPELRVNFVMREPDVFLETEKGCSLTLSYTLQSYLPLVKIPPFEAVERINRYGRL